MFKKIPGNRLYRIDLKGRVIDFFGKTVTLPRVSKEDVEIDLFGEVRRVKLRWLICFSWYEFGQVSGVEKFLDSIRFYPASHLLRIKSGCVPQFNEPVYYRDGFRIIPSHCRYAIDMNGVLIDTSKNEAVTAERLTLHGYISKYLYSPDRCKNRDVSIHRLVSLAWLPNSDFINKPIINHRNGVKTDYSLRNLEWCSYQENAQHAIDTGLNQTSVGMKTRDVVTGLIEIYQSSAELSRKLGLSRGWSPMSFVDRLPGFLHKQRYEIKRLDDETPWYYENKEHDPEAPSKQHFTVTILDKRTGEVDVITNSRYFFKKYRLWNVKNITHAASVFKEKYPDHEITLKRNTVNGPYRVIDKTGPSVTVIATLREVAAFIGIGYNELNLDLRRGRKFIYLGRWVVLARGADDDISDYQEKPKPYCEIKIDNGDSVITAGSIREASRLTGIMPRTIVKLCNTGKRYRGFTFGPVAQ